MANSLAGPAFFAAGTDPAWPSLNNNDPIPWHLGSKHADPNAVSLNVCIGNVLAVTTFLQGRVEVGKTGKCLSVTYPSSGKSDKDTLKTVGSEPAPSGRKWTINSVPGKPPTGKTAPSYLLLAEALLLKMHPEVSERYGRLSTSLYNALGHGAPYSEIELVRASSRADTNDTMMALSDAVYHALKQNEADGSIAAVAGSTQRLAPCDPFVVVAAPQPILSRSGVKNLIRRTLLRESGDVNNTIMLVGPTATFKSTMAKQAAVEAGAHLVVLQGRRNLSGEDFLGARRMVNGNTDWFDGPVAEAFRIATSEKVMLLVDEVARLDEDARSSFVTFLDRHTPDVVRRMGHNPHKEMPHHILVLPTEKQSEVGVDDEDRVASKKAKFRAETLLAPVDNLTVVFTTNLGAGYGDGSEPFTEAFLSRVRVQIEVLRPDRDLTEPIYRAVLDHGAVLEALYSLEAFVDDHQQPDSHFRRPLNVTNCVAFLEECAASLSEGLNPQEAFVQASELTLLAKVCPVMDDGLKDAVAAQLFRDEVRRRASTLAA